MFFLIPVFYFSHIPQASFSEFELGGHFYTYPNQKDDPPTFNVSYSERLPLHPNNVNVFGHFRTFSPLQPRAAPIIFIAPSDTWHHLYSNLVLINLQQTTVTPADLDQHDLFYSPSSVFDMMRFACVFVESLYKSTSGRLFYLTDTCRISLTLQ